MVIKKFIKLLLLLIFIFSNKYAVSSQIVDYETEIFINNLILEIKKVNNLNKNINFKLLSNNNINAFVDEKKTIHITSGLIENSNDYIALVSVLAHEVGHIHRNHISIRKLSINKLNKYKNISNFSIIAGSMISNSPEILQGLALSSAGSSNLYLNFSKEQETEADIYSVKTLSKLGVNSNSITDLLKTIEKKNLDKGISKENQRLSTHPYFEDRINLLNYLTSNKNYKIDQKLDLQFQFIRAKFLGYSENISVINTLEETYRLYANSILEAKNGNLISSLKILNELIKNNKNNIFLIETKADILFSYGFTKESIRFYKLVLKQYPLNSYAQIRIFSETNLEELSRAEIDELFVSNLNLLKKYYNNKNILLTYLRIAKHNNKQDWLDFFNFWLNKNKNNDNIIKKLNEFKKTNDKNLIELITIIENKYL